MNEVLPNDSCAASPAGPIEVSCVSSGGPALFHETLVRVTHLFKERE
jgi:hypothetical protein